MEQTKPKNVIVFGGAGGIGQGIIGKLKKEYHILAVDQSEAVYGLKNRDVEVLKMDLCSEIERQSLKIMLDELPSVYGVVFATGIMLPGSITELSDDDWIRTMNTNVNMLFYLSKILLPCLMKEKESHLIAFASHLGIVGSYNLTSYSASKAAVIEMIKCIALDYGGHGVIANCISPGFVKTEMMNKAMQRFATNKNWMFATGGLPKQHIDRQDIAEMVSFLMHQSSMNGENIVMDGGYSVR